MGVKVREKKKGSGEWYIFIDYKNKRKAKKIGKDKKLALEAATKIAAKLTLGQLDILDEETIAPTLKEYVSGDNLGWLETRAKLSLKKSTWMSYKHIIENHLLPAMGNKNLDDITSRMVSNLVLKLMKGNLRSGTVKNIKNCLSAIMKQACQDEYIPSNPVTGVIVPRPENERMKREPNPLTWEEKDYFEETFLKYQPQFYPIIVCGLRTGLRIGELLALKWEDIDFFNKTIHVQRNITRCNITTPKSKSSIRMVRMTGYLIEVMKEQQNKAKEAKLKNSWNDMPEWIFFNVDGSYLNYGNFIHRVWNKVMDKSQLQRRTPHDMRHTYATLRLSKGDSLAEVSKEMGHGSPDITYRTYYKWMPKLSVSDIDELDKRMLKNATIRNLSATG